MKITKNAFAGEFMKQFNGVVITAAVRFADGKHIESVDGKSKLYSVPNGGALFLTPEQVEE